MVFWDEEGGRGAPGRCKANQCPECVVIEARRRARAIAYQTPERMVTLTSAPEDWQALRDAVYNCVSHVREKAGRFDHVYVVEWGTEGGLHVHLLQHGDFIPYEVLQEGAVGAGFGSIVYIQRITPGTERCAADYLLKIPRHCGGGVSDVGLRRYLKINGGRLIHASKGFWRRGGTWEGALKELQGPSGRWSRISVPPGW